MKVTKSRSLIKAISYRFFGTLASFLIVYILTNKGNIAAIAALLDVIVKIIVYYFHERVWNKISWGRIFDTE